MHTTVVRWLSIRIWAAHHCYAGQIIFLIVAWDPQEVEGDEMFQLLSLKPQTPSTVISKIHSQRVFLVSCSAADFFYLSLFSMWHKATSLQRYLLLCIPRTLSQSQTITMKCFSSLGCLFGWCCCCFFLFLFLFLSSTTIFLMITITKRAVTCRSRKRYYMS